MVQPCYFFFFPWLLICILSNENNLRQRNVTKVQLFFFLSLASFLPYSRAFFFDSSLNSYIKCNFQ